MSFFNQFPVLQTERLTLRELALEDAEDIFNIQSDEEVARFLDWQPRKVEHSRFFVKWFKEGYHKKSAIRWGITLKDQGQVIGTIGYHDFHFNSRAELSYELSSSCWNRGITTEAAKAIISFGFKSLNLHRIQAWALPDNVSSMRLLGRMGFQEEGLLRKYAYIRQNDTWVDVRMFALLREEYFYRLDQEGMAAGAVE